MSVFSFYCPIYGSVKSQVLKRYKFMTHKEVILKSSFPPGRMWDTQCLGKD